MLEKEPGDVGSSYPRLNPHPGAHLILANADHRYQYARGTNLARGGGSHLILPHCKTFTMDHSGPFQILGIKFHVGALYALNCPSLMGELDAVSNIELDHLFKTSFDLPSLMADALSDSFKVCASLDDTLLPLMRESHEDKHSRLVNLALPLLARSSVSQIGAALGCSQRTIERSFLRVTKLTLKQFKTMTKLEAMLEFVSQREESQLNWADIAYQFGFSDQPHLIRYLKTSIDTTPSAYAKQRDLTIDVYGHFEKS